MWESVLGEVVVSCGRLLVKKMEQKIHSTIFFF